MYDASKQNLKRRKSTGFIPYENRKKDGQNIYRSKHKCKKLIEGILFSL